MNGTTLPKRIGVIDETGHVDSFRRADGRLSRLQRVGSGAVVVETESFPELHSFLECDLFHG